MGIPVPRVLRDSPPVHAPIFAPRPLVHDEYNYGPRAELIRKIEEAGRGAWLPEKPAATGIRRAEGAGDMCSAAHALMMAKKVMICTGMNSTKTDMCPRPDTDGPPGAAALGNALIVLKKGIMFVTDTANRPTVRISLETINPVAAEYCPFVEFNKTGLQGQYAAKALIDEFNPDVVVALGVPGRDIHGIRFNIRGKNINGFNSDIDELVNHANSRGIDTIAIGDDGNLAGMAGASNMPMTLTLPENQFVIRARHQVFSMTVNLGGHALAETLLAIGDRKEKSCTGNALDAMVVKTVYVGAADSVACSSFLGRSLPDGHGNELFCGVKGINPALQQQIVRSLAEITSLLTPDRDNIQRMDRTIGDPVVVGTYDSSDGAIFATRNLKGFVKARSPHNIKFVMVSDHDKSPYSGKSTLELTRLVSVGLRFTESLGPQFIAMVCNTACTTFPAALNGIETRVLNLIDVTSNAIAEHGGLNPVLLSTFATASHTMYADTVRSSPKRNPLAGAQNLVHVFAGDQEACDAKTDLASLINKRVHLCEDKTKIWEAINKFIDLIAEKCDLRYVTSLWLGCTHYPVIKHMIKDGLDARRRELGCMNIVEVIDPMEYQAAALIAITDDLIKTLTEKRKEISEKIKNITAKVCMFTSGDPNQVRPSVTAIFGHKEVPIEKADFSMLAE